MISLNRYYIYNVCLAVSTTGIVPQESTRSEDKVASTLSTNGIIPHESTRSEDKVASTLPDMVDTAPVNSRPEVVTPKVEPSRPKSKPLIVGMNGLAQTSFTIFVIVMPI